MSNPIVNDEENEQLAKNSRQLIDSGKTVNSKIQNQDGLNLGETKPTDASSKSIEDLQESNSANSSPSQSPISSANPVFEEASDGY